MQTMSKIAFTSLFVVLFLNFAGHAIMPAAAAPPAGAASGADTVSMMPGLVTPVASRLCGRGLSGRCTKGRAACARGSEAACAEWTAWSKACTKCATAFAQCRSNLKNSCASCISAHDACEAKAR